MLHACVQRFDVTENLEKFCKILGTKQALDHEAFSMFGTRRLSIIGVLKLRGDRRDHILEVTNMLVKRLWIYSSISSLLSTNLDVSKLCHQMFRFR